MRISDLPNRKLNTSLPEKSIKPIDGQPRPVSFLEQLNSAADQQVKGKLDNLLAEVDKQGKKLLDQMTIRELKKYKEVVKRFLGEAFKSSFKVKEQAGWDRRGKYKVFTLVEEIDKKMEQLSSLLMEEHKDQLLILETLDEIRGMLLDIYS